MEHNQVTPEWIDEQRQISEIVDMVCEDAPGSEVPLLKQIEKSQTAALDALEAAYAEVARLNVELASVTRERDAAVHDIRLGYGCETCKHVHVGQGEPYMCYLGGCKSPIDWEKWEWRGLCALHGDEKGV